MMILASISGVVDQADAAHIGKEFCSNLFAKDTTPANSSVPCDKCHGECGKKIDSLELKNYTEAPGGLETMPCDQAWKTLKVCAATTALLTLAGSSKC
jgi:hypothetical protein